MSLELKIEALTAAVEANTAALTAVLAGATAAKTTDAPADKSESEAPKTEPKKATAAKGKVADKPAADGETEDFSTTFPDLKKKLAAWLGEFSKAEDKDAPDGAHPEVAARKEALKETLGKLKVEKLGEIEGDAKKVAALNKWVETKATKLDHVGAGEGRFAADPSEDASEDLDDL